MNNFLKSKIASVIILVATFILAAIAVFTAIKLYQLRNVAVAPNVPASNPQAAATPKPILCSFNFKIASPTPTPTKSPSPTPTRSPSPTPTRSPSPTPTPTRSPSPSPTPTKSPSPTPTKSPSPTPTPTIAGTAQCISVIAYSQGWVRLTDADLIHLTSGTTVNFCVTGSTNLGSFDKAQFMINSTLYPETSSTRPGSSDFCQSYTIQPTDITITVQAKIHHTLFGWFGQLI